MKELIIMIGIPASGKSTFVRQKFSKSHTIISLDNLKTRFRENLLIKETIKKGQNAIIDNTNISNLERAKYIKIFGKFGYRILGYCFFPNLKDCLARNKFPNRTSVPEVAIFDKYKKFENPQYCEGFSSLFQVKISGNKFEIEKLRENKDEF